MENARKTMDDNNNNDKSGEREKEKEWDKTNRGTFMSKA